MNILSVFSLFLFSTVYFSSSLGAFIEVDFSESVSEVRYSTCLGFNSCRACSDWDHVTLLRISENQ